MIWLGLAAGGAAGFLIGVAGCLLWVVCAMPEFDDGFVPWSVHSDAMVSTCEISHTTECGLRRVKQRVGVEWGVSPDATHDTDFTG